MNSQDFHSGMPALGVQAHVNPKSPLTLQFRIVIEQDEDGVFVAECSNLPGCISQGKTRDEALAKKGYRFDHPKGSHMLLQQPTPPYRRLTVPNHKHLAKGTLRAILRESGLTVEEFVNLL